MLKDKKLDEVLDEVDSNSPTPGGGSVSALVSAFAVSLARMYAHLSINKKKFLALDESVQKDFISSFESLASLKEELLKAADKDKEAYDLVMSAYKLPKDSDEEKEMRNKAIKEATYIAIESPFNIMNLSIEAMRLMVNMIDFGNKNAISDLACGILFLDAALNGASLNVLINLSTLDEDEAKAWSDRVTYLVDESKEIKDSSIFKIKNIL